MLQSVYRNGPIGFRSVAKKDWSKLHRCFQKISDVYHMNISMLHSLVYGHAVNTFDHGYQFRLKFRKTIITPVRNTPLEIIITVEIFFKSEILWGIL